MYHSMFSADDKYERSEIKEKDIKLNVSIEGSTLNLMSQCSSDSFFNNGHATKNLNKYVKVDKRTANIIREFKAYVIFLKDSLPLNGLHPVEDILIVNLHNRVLSPTSVHRALINYDYSKADSSEIDSINLFRKQFNHFTIHKTSTQLAGCISKSMKMSSKFSKSFLNFIERSHPYNFQSNSLNHVLIVSMTETNVSLNHSWDKKMSTLVVKESILDDAMNWLSTLGGAYSALGDHDDQFADLAGSTSMEQLKIALHLASPPLIIRCKLFYSISLTQRKQFKMAKRIIRTQYQAARALPIEDKVLINMCHGIWNKLRYLWTLSKTRAALNPS